MINKFDFTHQGYECTVSDFRGVPKSFIQFSVKDPNAPDRIRAVSISTTNANETIPTDSELVNYMLDKKTVQDMLSKLVRDGFPTNYDSNG
jgi:hypothetical protein